MALLAELTGGSLFLVIFVVVTAFVLMLRTQRQLKQSPKSKPKPASAKGLDKAACRPGSQEMKVQRDVERWEVRMHDLARELSAQLDSKISALEHLIQDAERQIVRLDERLSRKPQGNPEAAIHADRSASLPAPHITTQAAALAANSLVGQLAQQSTSRPSKERRFDEVYALADAGHAPAVIANRVGSPVGEIELILSLRKRG
jgi:hypothetical protein